MENKKILQSLEDQVVTLRIKKHVVELIDKERSKFNAPRSVWITQAIVEKLEKLGYEIE
ncbi:MAG: hypothetical protein RLZZ86_3111 [Cyanobacteriota bacterium]|jgi:hypothetical protein